MDAYNKCEFVIYFYPLSTYVKLRTYDRVGSDFVHLINI